MPKRAPEYELQCAVVAHLRARAMPDMVWFHVPNGGKRGIREAARFKAMGVRAGVADLLLFYDCDSYALELKAPTGRNSGAQRLFWRDWEKAGGRYACHNNLNDALAQLERWGLLRPAIAPREAAE